MEFVFVVNIQLVVLLFSQLVFCGALVRSSVCQKFASCRLAGFSQQNLTESEIACALTCLQEEENCVAYQWDAASGSCKRQDKVHITASIAAEDSVGVMRDEEVDSLVNVTCAAAADCAEILASDPTSESGVYPIMVAGQFLHHVWCDMDTDGGGWTVFLKRLDGSEDFNQGRATYKAGFGDVNGEYWLGLDLLHALTTSNTYELRVDLSDWAGTSVYSLYESMVVADETEQYRLTLGPYLGGAGGDCLVLNNGMKFSTKDLDVDSHGTYHCAEFHAGGFWFHGCSLCHPTAKYYSGGAYPAGPNDGIQWRSWSAHTEMHYSMKTLDMKLRP